MGKREYPKRIIREAIFGIIACYELDEKRTTEQELIYIHKGIVKDMKDAKLWLANKEPSEFIKVYHTGMVYHP